MHSTCTAHAQHMHSTCTTPAQHMHSTCTAHAQHMHSTCTTHAQHMHSTCTAHAQHMHSTCTAHAQHMHSTCTGTCTGTCTAHAHAQHSPSLHKSPDLFICCPAPNLVHAAVDACSCTACKKLFFVATASATPAAPSFLRVPFAYIVCLPVAVHVAWSTACRPLIPRPTQLHNTTTAATSVMPLWPRPMPRMWVSAPLHVSGGRRQQSRMQPPVGSRARRTQCGPPP